MSTLVVLPVLVPLLAAAVSALAYRSPRLQAAVGVGGSAALLAAALLLARAVLERGVLAAHIGAWPSPFGIALVADLLGAVMVVLTAITALAVALYSLADVDARRRGAGFYVFFHVLLMGVCGAFLTGDIFNLYVCFEVLLMASFVLLALGGERPQMEGALKYVTLNLVSSALLLAAVGILYGVAGTLSMAHLSVVVPPLAETHPALVTALAGLFLVSFGIKAGLFPLYFWLPSSYHTPPVSVSALFAGLLTKVGVYALIRVFTLVFAGLNPPYRLLLLLSGATMLVGVLGAYSQSSIRRILSFHIISQIGYMVVGLGLLVSPDPQVRRLGLLAAVFYIAHHILVKTNLFLIGGLVLRIQGSEKLEGLGGLFRGAPWLAALFLVPALSLAGIPPLSGFWSKLAVIRAGLAAGEWLVVAAALAAGVMTLMSMMKIWNEAFWKPRPGPEPKGEGLRGGAALSMILPALGLAALTLLIGFFPEALFALADRAAEQLLDPTPYRDAAGGPWPGDGP
jgi:multicomponent Na+:H+ antiporter subunit D